MPTLNLDDQYVPVQKPPKLPTILKAILLVLLAAAILGGATANGYLYFKSREIDSKLAALQASLSEMANDVASIERQSDSDVASEISEIASKLDSIEEDIRSIKTDIAEIQSDVNHIESDVSSIQLKVGY